MREKERKKTFLLMTSNKISFYDTRLESRPSHTGEESVSGGRNQQKISSHSSLRFSIESESRCVMDNFRVSLKLRTKTLSKENKVSGLFIYI